jgi:transmembrane sensor
MNLSPTTSRDAALRETAARWTVRRDRGLSATEAIEFELWLALDERHVAAMQRTDDSWSALDRIPENIAAPVLVAATRRRSFWRRAAALGWLTAAAALAVAGFLTWRSPAHPALPVASGAAATAGPRQLTLSDGTVVQLNTGGEVSEQFTNAERHVLLARGEAHFAVTKNPARPFIVHAGVLRVRAVGTAFNVNLQASQIEVLVTEGRVGVERVDPDVLPRPEAGALQLNAGERAVASTATTAGIVVGRVDATEMSRELAWQAPLLRLGGATLAELVLEFQRRSGQRVVLADPALAQLRVGGRFRADDAAGFASLMAATLDLEVENAADGTLVLRKKTPESR